MGGGYVTPRGDSVDELVRILKKANQRITELERPTGTQTSQLYDQVQAVLANITSQVNTIASAWMAANAYTSAQVDAKIASPGAISPSSVAASGGVSGSSGTFSSSLSSVGAYNTDVSALPGARETTWQHNSGVFGFAPSTRDLKVNLKALPFSAADVMALSPSLYQYKAQIAIKTDPTNPYYDPNYVVPWDVGLMAEDLIAHNMSCFVVFEEDGVTPKSINYDLFGAVVPLVLAANFNSRLKQLGV